MGDAKPEVMANTPGGSRIRELNGKIQVWKDTRTLDFLPVSFPHLAKEASSPYS